MENLEIIHPDNCCWDEEDLKENVTYVCNHFEYCVVKKISGRDCADYRNCQTWKFYHRYPGWEMRE